MRALRTIIVERSWWQAVLFITIGAIILIQISGLIGTRGIVPMFGWGEGIGDKSNIGWADSWNGRFVRWDSGYYIGIAQNGYRPNGTEWAFFPLYSLLSNYIGKILGISLFSSGLFVSIVSFIAAILFLYQYVLIDHNKDVALWTCVWVAFFPMSFFFIAFYPEALLLFESVASIYFARRGNFIAGGLAIALAGATRPTAFLLAIPYVLEFFQQHDFSWQKLLRFGIGILVSPVGFFGYLFFFALQAGSTDFINVYTSLQALNWKRFLTWPWVTLFDGIRACTYGIGINLDWYSRFMACHDLMYAFLGLLAGIWALFRLRRSIAVYLFASMLFLYANHGPYGYAFWSIPRYIAVLFPIYISLGLFSVVLPVRLRWLPITASAILLCILSAWFASGRFIA